MDKRPMQVSIKVSIDWQEQFEELRKFHILRHEFIWTTKFPNFIDTIITCYDWCYFKDVTFDFKDDFDILFKADHEKSLAKQ